MRKQFTIFLILIFVLGLVPVNFSSAEDLSNKLSGRILLQVEGVGQAWYIDPGTKQRAFLGRPADAFQIMRELGLGISEKDYNSFNGYAPQNLSGRILLRVEANGEAYYVNPTDLKMYYLGRPADAFKVMREKGLGITNEDLTTVPIFQKYKEQTEANTAAINSLNQKIEEQQNQINELKQIVNTNTSTSTIDCTEDQWVCSSWGSCSTGGVKTRLCSISDDCENVSTPSPVTSQSCDYAPNTCSSWTYSNWSACSTSGQQTRTVASSLPNGCTGGSPTTSQSCSITSPTCTSWTYSGWGVCSTNGQQTRTIASSLPNGCIGGSPVTSQSCTPEPQFKVIISSDKSQIGANGQDTATITVKITDVAGIPISNKTVLETSPKNQTFTTDSNGIVTFTVTSTQAGDFYAAVTVEGQNYRTTINAISTAGSVSGNITYSGDVRMGTASGAVRAPASDQILAFFIASSIDSSISELKIKSIKLKLINLSQTWFKNVRITNSPPCTQGRFCSVQTIAGPASYNLGSDGILTVIPDTPVNIYKDKAIYIIADMIANIDPVYGTNWPILTYQILVIDSSSIELTGKVNGYNINTINLNLTSGLIPVTATVNSNTCMSEKGVPVACY